VNSTSRAKYHLYSSWDLSCPNPSPRSRLYHLTPLGIGTPLTESLTGYIARLAQEHCVSVANLLSHELLPTSNRPHLLRPDSNFVNSGTFVKTLVTINGRSRNAEGWIGGLERLTLQTGLRYLTMLTWQHVLTHKSLLRTTRAWCPQCLEEQLNEGKPVYEQLLWSLGTVEVCPHHEIELENVCPHCHQQTRPFAYKARPGRCFKCLNWLINSNTPRRPQAPTIQPSDFKYKLWIANQMGQLIGAAPSQLIDPPRERIRDFMPACIEHTTGGNVTVFADIFGLDRFLIFAWLREHLPPTDLLLKICYRFDVSFFDLVTKGHVVPTIDLSQQYHQVKHGSSMTRDRNGSRARRMLLQALEEDPPATLRQLADRLEYKLTRSLQTRFPELTKKLTARNRAFHAANGVHRKIPKRDLKRIRLSLQEALKKELPPPLSDIALSNGFEDLFTVRKKFPDLCRAIVTRRAEHRRNHRNEMQIRIDAILLEYPPPTTHEASKRLGYKTGSGLGTGYPEAFKKVLKRRTEYEKTLYKDLRVQLRTASTEDPPRCLREIAKAFDKKYLYLHEHFPKECKAIIDRYSQFRKEIADEKKAQARKRLRRLALDLHARDYLSVAKLKKASNGPTGLSPSELCALVREVRKELGIPRRLGRIPKK
jgi:AraC-like DNA-binding protein